MATTRATVLGAANAPNDEFLQLLCRGGELLAAGNIVQAKDQLEKAFSLQPENEEGKNLLGLTYFKLGLYERAVRLYENLVQENPADPTLRVNLGLVYLKTNSLPRAIHEFATATDLAPDHTKAHNYLGLALAQTGQHAKAREHFLLAGSQAMADKMALVLAETGAPPEGGEGRAQTTASEQAGLSDLGTDAEGGWMPGEQSAPPSDSFVLQFTSSGFGGGAAPGTVPTAVPTEWGFPQVPPPPIAEAPGALLADLVSSLQALPDGAVSPFDIRPELVLITVQSELLTRLSGLIAYTGAIDFRAERKRFGGRVTDRGFGEGGSQMTRARGNGVLLLDPRKQVFVSTDLGGEPAYFREDIVFAIEEPVLFENGRLPSDVAPDLDLVYVRGQGKVLLSLPTPPRSIEVTGGRPVTVPLDNLVGWHGNLTPRISIVACDDAGKMSRAGVELSGAGFVLFTHPLS